MKGFPNRTAKQRRRAAKRARQRALPTKRPVPGAHEPGRFVDYPMSDSTASCEWLHVRFAGGGSNEIEVGR